MRTWSIGIGLASVLLVLGSANALAWQRAAPPRIGLAALGALPPAPLLAGEGIRYACEAETRSCDSGTRAFCCPESTACDFENASCAAWR